MLKQTVVVERNGRMLQDLNEAQTLSLIEVVESCHDSVDLMWIEFEKRGGRRDCCFGSDAILLNVLFWMSCLPGFCGFV